MEAAIGIEPMNKGFAVRIAALSPNITCCYRPIFIDLSQIDVQSGTPHPTQDTR